MNRQRVRCPIIKLLRPSRIAIHFNNNTILSCQKNTKQVQLTMQKFQVNLQKGIKFFLLLDRGHYYGSLWIGLWGSLKGSLGFLSQGQSYDLTRVALGRKAHCRLSIQAKSFVCLQARVTQSYRYLLTDIYLPIPHDFSLQSWEPFEIPVHCLPPYRGGGSSQDLVLVCVPNPHSALHKPHDDQRPQ